MTPEELKRVAEKMGWEFAEAVRTDGSHYYACHRNYPPVSDENIAKCAMKAILETEVE